MFMSFLLYNVAFRTRELGTAGAIAFVFFLVAALLAFILFATSKKWISPFASVVQAADVPSHDAVVALVRAAELVGTTAAPAVREALAGGALDQPQGMAGPPLDFRYSDALAAGSVRTLDASTSNPGLRPPPADPATAPTLFWFAVG
jgi:hypothetical protein